MNRSNSTTWVLSVLELVSDHPTREEAVYQGPIPSVLMLWDPSLRTYTAFSMEHLDLLETLRDHAEPLLGVPARISVDHDPWLDCPPFRALMQEWG